MVVGTVDKLENSTMEGWIIKQGAVVTNWKRRWFVLKSDFLYYFKTQQDSDPTGVVPVRGCTVTEDTQCKRSNSFMVALPDNSRTYHFQAPNNAVRLQYDIVH